MTGSTVQSAKLLADGVGIGGPSGEDNRSLKLS